MNYDKLIFEDSNRVILNLGSKNNLLSGKNVLITGAAGFLGSQFVHYFNALNDSSLLNEKMIIYALDNFKRGIPKWMGTDCNTAFFKIIQTDITQNINLPDNIDFIIHAASIASPKYYRDFPIETMDANVVGLRNLLEYSRKHRIISFLNFSTSEIYGNPDSSNIPTKENYNGNVSCTGPRSCYDESKRYGETLCSYFYQVYNVPIKVVRPFNNYGPGLNIDDKRVIPDFFSNVLNGRDIIIFSNGSPTRTFCYISDAITGYLLVLLSESNGEAFNIGTDSPEISVGSLAKLILKTCNSSNKIVYQISHEKNYLIDNPQRRCPDITKAKKILGYNPKVSLEAGLRYTFNWYMNSLTGNNI
ncbi:MAG: NAD-dependent epimerase/dehydratase family protein [Stygiobacter sp.]|nr:MAG: NAD-dependent epimerase/dehydratase family protein [Stygiobacter sp.]